LLMFYFLIYFSDFCQTNYLNIYWTDLCEIGRIGRTLAVDERSEVIFHRSRNVAVTTNFVGRGEWASNPHLVVRMTFARAAPPAYVKKGNCYAGRRHKNYLLRWTQANQLSNKLTIVNRRLEG